MAIDLNFAYKVRQVLLANDLRGITFKKLNERVRSPNHSTADLRQLLAAWQRRKWVDNYTRTTHLRRYSEIWRATFLLYQEWPVVVNAIEQLLLAPDLPWDRASSEQRSADPAPASPAVADTL